MNLGQKGNWQMTKRWNNVEELREEREEIASKFETGLPKYLVDFFDAEEMKFLNAEKYRKLHSRKYEYSLEERTKIVKAGIERFWETNRFQLVKKRKRVGSHLEPVYEEPPTHDEKIEYEEELTDEERSAIVAACETSIYAFAVRYFSHYLKYPSSRLHKYLYSYLERQINNTRRTKGFKHAIAAPRGNAKSSLVSCIFPLWCIVYNKKKFIIIVSDTAGQAEDFLEEIKRELDSNELLKRDFPHIVGKGPTWRQDEIITTNNIKVMALGTGAKVRGRRFGTSRPDQIICHEKGTNILYKNKWIPVEKHPSAVERVSDGYEVKIQGLPFSEVVTKEHRYYTKLFNRQKNVNIDIGNGWTEAKDLKNYWKFKHYIGFPIDDEIIQPKPIDVYFPIITKRDETGRIEQTRASFKKEVPDEFYDPEFWWFVGLWWGDGYSSGKCQMNISFNKKDTKNIKRLKKILKKYNHSCSCHTRGNMILVVFSWSKFARWLKSWRIGNSRKTPPQWVEKIDPVFQKELVKGYIDSDGFVDYTHNQIRITSIHLEGLLSLRRILTRLDIPSSIRNGIDPHSVEIEGRICRGQKKYDIRFRKNASKLGYDIKDQDRYTLQTTFIQDGYLWSKFKSKKEIKDRIFIPIKTEDSTYITNFGKSHNCDDLENSDLIRSPTSRDFLKNQWFNKDLLYCGDRYTDFFIVGTIIGKESLLNSLVNPEEYPDWTSRVFKAVEKFSDSPLWDEWEHIAKNHFDPLRAETARRFFEEHREEMLEGTKVLWPTGDPYYGLMVYKISDPSGFQSEKQNNPLDPSKILMPEESLHFRTFSSDPEIKRILEDKLSFYYGALDPSLGKKSTSDYSVILTLLKDRKSGVLLVVDMDVKRRSIDAQIEAVLKKYERYEYRNFGIETNGFQVALEENLRKESKKAGLYIPIEELKNYRDKHMRIQGIVPLVLDGTIIFDRTKAKHNQQYALGLDQISTYCEGATHDDVPDALEMAIRLCRKKRFKLITKQNR